MLKFLSPRVHGYIDYLFDLALFVAPTALGFTELPTSLCYLLGLGHLMMNLVTQYPLGALRWMRFSTHGSVEVVVAIALILMPWLTGFTDDNNAQMFFVISGLLLTTVWFATDYRDNTVPADTIELGTMPYTTLKHPTPLDPNRPLHDDTQRHAS